MWQERPRVDITTADRPYSSPSLTDYSTLADHSGIALAKEEVGTGIPSQLVLPLILPNWSFRKGWVPYLPVWEVGCGCTPSLPYVDRQL